MLPEQGAFVVPGCSSVDEGHQAAAFLSQRQDGVTFVSAGIGGLGQLQTCRHDVDEMAGRLDDAALLAFEACGPLDDGGRCRAAVERFALPVAEGRVDGTCPSCSQIVVGELVARHCGVVDYLLSVACAVVAVEVADAVVL